jgi:hypothetical protein
MTDTRDALFSTSSEDEGFSNVVRGSLLADLLQVHPFEPLSLLAFVEDTETLPSGLSADVREFLRKNDFRRIDTVFGNHFLDVYEFAEGWRKRQTGNPERVRLVDKKEVTCGIITYKPGKIASLEIDI